jgi:hypothetical protein
MLSQYLNTKSNFYTGQSVVVTHNNTGEMCCGTVTIVNSEPVNRGNPHGDHTDHIYVQFDGLLGREFYSKWLTRGSPLYCKKNNKMTKCVIRNIEYDNGKIIQSLRVAEDDGGYMMSSLEYNVSVADIHSMLIWRVGYDISLL